MSTLLEYLDGKRIRLSDQMSKAQYITLYGKDELVKAGAYKHLDILTGEKEMLIEIEQLIFCGKITELK